MSRKILIIEDDEVIRENTAEILELSNYEVETAHNGKVGVAKAKELQPDLIVCDIMMPELDGYGVLHILCKNPETSSIPFIFLSAKSEKSDIRKGMALGADDYLTKPFEEMDLLNAIESRLKRSDTFRKDYSSDMAGLNLFVDEARELKELEALSADRKVRKFRKKETVYYEGDYPNVLFFLSKGIVKLQKTHEDGKEYITRLVQEGEYFGYLPIMENTAYGENAITMEESEVCRIPKDDFLSLIKSNRDVSSRFIKMISNNLIDKEKLLLSLAYDSVRKRVANALITLQDKFQKEKDAPLRIDISRSDIASMVGTASESVIRTLADFKEEELIQVEGKKITVLNKTGLEKVW